MLILVFILYAFFGFTFTLGKIMLDYAPPFFIIGLRMMIGGAILLTYLSLQKKIRCALNREDIWLYLQFTFFGIYLFYSARAWGLQYVSTTKTALLFNLSPFFTAFFAYLVHKETLTLRKVMGLLIGFIGMIPILMTSSSKEVAYGELLYISFPELIIIISVASLSYGHIIMQQLVKHRNCSPAFANGISMFLGGILAYSTSLVFENTHKIVDVKILMSLMAIQILLSNIVCANLHAFLLKKYSATFMSFASFLAPLYVAAYGWLLLNETITLSFFISFAIVLIGLSIYYYDDFRKARIAPLS